VGFGSSAVGGSYYSVGGAITLLYRSPRFDGDQHDAASKV